MLQPERNGIEQATTMADLSIRTEVLSIASLTPHLPHWSALDDPLKSYLVQSKNWPQDALAHISRAANCLSAPAAHLVAFPTETVYGLGADATRSQCVRRIYQAKNRPADNPLIVHIASLAQLSTLTGSPLPTFYKPLVAKFWPGPLTIILPLPDPSPFAPEVSHNLHTFGVRMPATPLARLLIALADRPIAAPSANTSKRPSTTTAAHVLEDLDWKVDLILDGGPCGVGVESTVVDGTCVPPAILRPGGVGIDDVRALGGVWADTVVGYNDVKKYENSNGLEAGPRAPGMKYKHYAPKGKVHLFEYGTNSHKVRQALSQSLVSRLPNVTSPTIPAIGLIRTSELWPKWLGYNLDRQDPTATYSNGTTESTDQSASGKKSVIFPSATGTTCQLDSSRFILYDMALGPNVADVAREIFAALRACDELGCEVILVEGLPEAGEKQEEGIIASGFRNGGLEATGLATAVMNRLRKAGMG